MRPAPRLGRCRTLEPDELPARAGTGVDSVDGRIYGPSRRAVLGVVHPPLDGKPMKTIKAFAAGLCCAARPLAATCYMGGAAAPSQGGRSGRTPGSFVHGAQSGPPVARMLIFLAFALAAGLVANFFRRDAQARKFRRVQVGDV